MNKRLIFLILAVFMSTAVLGAETERKTLLRDGFALMGVDGKLVLAVMPTPPRLRSKTVVATMDSGAAIRPDPNLAWCGSGWSFELDSDVSDYRSIAPARTKLELLPSSALERMIADANERSGTSCRLWGWTTKYKGTNYIFPNRFLPIGKISMPQSQAQQKERKPTEKPSAKDDKRRPAVSEPNDILTMPKEIMERLKARKIARPKQLTRATEQNSILVDRSAFLVKLSDGRPVFVLDALGRNVKPVSLRPLPCEVLELAEQKQSAVPEPIRFKIAGIMTKYKGENYLLLQKATRVYNYQNFGR